jgi:hypothetical protein
LSGEKIICLAVTEPTAGSDVAQLKCTAVLNKEKTHYIINGVKKWYTFYGVRLSMASRSTFLQDYQRCVCRLFHRAGTNGRARQRYDGPVHVCGRKRNEGRVAASNEMQWYSIRCLFLY